MTASAIAEVVRDIEDGRVRQLPGQGPLLPGFAAGMPVIDATAIYHSLLAKEAVMLYEDHPSITPPWPAFHLAYVNEFGNVIVIVCAAIDDETPWETAEPVDWATVRWALTSLVFCGGYSKSVPGPIPTTGPVFCWQYAIGAQGEPLDLHWRQTHESQTGEMWTNSQLVTLQALNFLNCRNVQIVEPHRPRAERRRIARTGVTVSEINVFPIGRSARSAKLEPVGVPLTSVRGHFAHYGPQYDRALLFGKYAGRYWIPQHARGTAELGEVEHSYTLRPD